MAKERSRPPIYHGVDRETVYEGGTTDVYFERTEEILEAEGRDSVPVHAEVTSGSLPDGWPWGVVAGLDEALSLLAECPAELTVHAVPEGTLFRPYDAKGVRVPLVTIEGPYGPFAALETPLLGFLCQASGVATKAARLRKAAGEATLLSFGIRRVHPANAAVVDRAAWIGGVDGVASLAGAEAIGEEPVGTVPHALVLMLDGIVDAMEAFDRAMDEAVPRLALVDTLYDEREEALDVAEALGERLDGVRLDTPESRRGSLASIAQEVRWALDEAGHEHVDVVASGGLDEEDLAPLHQAGVTGFGVGTSISNAPVVNYALDIVSIDGESRAKRGKFPGRKMPLRCPSCRLDLCVPWGQEAACPDCGEAMEPLLEPVIEDGELLVDDLSPEPARQRVLDELEAWSRDEEP